MLTEQVEFADVILINKADLVSAEELSELRGVLRRLNPEARLVTCQFGQAPLTEVLGTGRFSFERASQAAGWLKELRGEHPPETETYGISSFVYRRRRPFHPERLWAFFHGETGGDEWQGVLRSKGFFWLATRMDAVGIWSQAGAHVASNPAGTGGRRNRKKPGQRMRRCGLRFGRCLTVCAATDGRSLCLSATGACGAMSSKRRSTPVC